MEIETFNYTSTYPITFNSTAEHANIYNYQTNYNYQYSSENLVWNSSENLINQQSDFSSISSPTSFYCPNQTINSTNSDEAPKSVDNCAKSKRGRKKGSGGSKNNERVKATKRNTKRSDSIPTSPSIIKKRRLAANARERRRMNGLNTAFDK
jgi:hypothetical protein